MKLPMPAMLLLVGALVSPFAEGAVPSLADKRSLTVAERAKAAYAAAMATVEASKESSMPQKAVVNMAAKQAIKVVAKELTKKDVEHLQQKEEKEHAQLAAANQRAEKLEAELSAERAALSTERAAKKSIRDQKSMAASNAEVMMHDMHSTLTDERVERVAAEKKVDTLGTELSDASKNQKKLSYDLEKANAMLLQKSGGNLHLSAAVKQAHTETEDLRRKLAVLKKTSDQKASELSKQLKHVQTLEMADKFALNKTMEDDAQEMAQLKKALNGKVAKTETLRKTQKTRAFSLYKNTMGKMHKMSAENTKIKMHFIKQHQGLKTLRIRLSRTEQMAKAEHTNLVAVTRAQMKTRKKLGEVLSALHKANQHVAQLSKTGKKDSIENKKLRKENNDLVSQLQQTKLNLENEVKAFDEAEKARKQTSESSKRNAAYKDKSRKRLRNLWTALKAKTAQLKVHDEELAIVQQKLAAAQLHEQELSKKVRSSHSDGGKLVKVEYLEKLQEEELKALHKHVANVTQKEREFKTAHAKLAVAEAEEKHRALELAAAKAAQNVLSKKLEAKLAPNKVVAKAKLLKAKTVVAPVKAKPAVPEKVVQLTKAQLDSSKQEMSETQERLKALNDQLASDEGKIKKLNVALLQSESLVQESGNQLRGKSA